MDFFSIYLRELGSGRMKTKNIKSCSLSTNNFNKENVTAHVGLHFKAPCTNKQNKIKLEDSHFLFQNLAQSDNKSK